jgi:shikimate kinase
MREISKIVLIGFMGSGKTSVAARIAPAINFHVCDMDAEIVRRSSYPSIPAIFAEHGESYFRDLESQVAESLSHAQRTIVSTGGGVVTRPSNLTHLKTEGTLIIYLKASFEELAKRIGDFSDRPLFQDHVKARKLFDERIPLYEAVADLIVNTDGESLDSVCSTILHNVESLLCRA